MPVTENPYVTMIVEHRKDRLDSIMKAFGEMIENNKKVQRRILLEAAATAAGFEVYGFDEQENACIDPVDYVPWNPITNSADEEELENRLGLVLDWGISGVSVDDCYELYSKHENRDAARRMAGTKAAAYYVIGYRINELKVN